MIIDFIIDYLLGTSTVDAAVETATAKKLSWRQKISAFISIVIILIILAIIAIVLFVWLG